MADRLRQYLAEIRGQEEARAMAPGEVTREEAISKSTLEEAARESTLHGHETPGKRFWKRQQGKAETIIIG